MICLAVRLLANPGSEAQLKGQFARLTAESRKEPGCLMYVFHQSTESPRRFLVYEQYVDEAALAAHRNSHHFQHYGLNGAYKHIESREVELYTPLET